MYFEIHILQLFQAFILVDNLGHERIKDLENILEDTLQKLKFSY